MPNAMTAPGTARRGATEPATPAEASRRGRSARYTGGSSRGVRIRIGFVSVVPQSLPPKSGRWRMAARRRPRCRHRHSPTEPFPSRFLAVAAGRQETVVCRRQADLATQMKGGVMRLQGPRSPRSWATGGSGARARRRESMSSAGKGLAVLSALTIVAALLVPGTAQAAAADPCGPGGNPVACENSKPGSPASEWDIGYIGDARIQGFTTDDERQPGGTVRFKIKASEFLLRRRLPAGLLRRRRRPATGADLDGLQPGQPASLRHRPQHLQLRLRNLVGLDPVGGAVHRGLRGLHRQADDGHATPTRSPSSSGTTRRTATSS